MQILPYWFIYVAAAMRILGGIAYARATFTGRSQPHAISWLIWSITPMITFFAELKLGVGLIAIVTLALAINPLIVFLTAIFKDRRLLKIDWFDSICITIAVLGIVLWVFSSNPILAIVLAISADIVSAIPTIRKTIKKPSSEFPVTFLMSALSMILALLATSEVTFAAFAFPVYVLAINLIIAGLALRRPKRRIKRVKK